MDPTEKAIYDDHLRLAKEWDETADMAPSHRPDLFHCYRDIGDAHLRAAQAIGGGKLCVPTPRNVIRPGTKPPLRQPPRKEGYRAALKDPRWKKRSADRRKTENDTCQACADRQETLHVHHRFYDLTRKPWEYEDRDLPCYCVTCHWLSHIDKRKLRIWCRKSE